ncbi:MAG: nitrate reductase subunit beta, partial [Gallionella sp.]|nr:nitrate reductase subunit beta [Gallionella sp.]
NRMIAMRSYQRMKRVEGVVNTTALQAVGMTEEMAQDMYRYLAIANYEDRFVIPTGHEEERLDDAHGFQGQVGFSFGNDSSTGISKVTLFPRRRKESMEPREKAPLASDQ